MYSNSLGFNVPNIVLLHSAWGVPKGAYYSWSPESLFISIYVLITWESLTAKSHLLYFTDQPDVRINRGNTEIECRNKQQGKEITWYTYGSVAHGLDVFTNVTSGTKYTVPSSGGIFTCTREANKSSVTSKDFCNFHKTFIIPPADGTYHIIG